MPTRKGSTSTKVTPEDRREENGEDAGQEGEQVVVVDHRTDVRELRDSERRHRRGESQRGDEPRRTAARPIRRGIGAPSTR
jgi:hypothetical protein